MSFETLQAIFWEMEKVEDPGEAIADALMAIAELHGITQKLGLILGHGIML